MGLCDYGYKPEMVFYSMKDGETYMDSEEKQGELYMGFELELDGSCCYEEDLDDCAEAIEYFTNEMIYVKEDCSLDNGIECVSYPMTIERVFDFNFADMLREAHEYGEYANETCGFHVHVNRGYFEDWQEVLKVGKLWSRFYRRFRMLGERDEEHARHWATWNNIPDDSIDSYDTQRETRYHAVNVTNRDTVEFRLFSASDDENKLKFMLDVVQASVKFALKHTFADIAEMSWRTAMNGLREEAYDKDLYDTYIGLSLERVM